jgi:hypothetical protein
VERISARVTKEHKEFMTEIGDGSISNGIRVLIGNYNPKSTHVGEVQKIKEIEDEINSHLRDEYLFTSDDSKKELHKLLEELNQKKKQLEKEQVLRIQRGIRNS